MSTHDDVTPWFGLVVLLALAGCGGGSSSAPGGAAPALPAFTTQPGNASVLAPDPATFTVVATGTPTPTLQWQVSTDGGATFADLPGATGGSYTTPATSAGDDGHRFRVIATNDVGRTTSSVATLTVTAAASLSLLTTSPLPAGTVNAPYSVTLAASGGTPPYTWSVADGSTLPAFLTLSASTGVLSGTAPGVEAMYGWSIQVADSALPPNTARGYFDLVIEVPCDTGHGSATVDGAPVTVGGRFCPQTVNGPVGPNGLGLIHYGWIQTFPYGGGAYHDGVVVVFDPVSGAVAEVSFALQDPTRSWTYLCAAVGTVDYPACSGVAVDTGTGRVSFTNTVVGSGSSPPFTLNGLLFYVP
jgi:hypothetical protein